MVKKYSSLILGIFSIILLSLFLIRLFSEVQLEDVSPQRFCEESFIHKSSTLMVIPILNNISIAENKTWCDDILKLNKTLVMHGVFHTPGEFNILRNESYILEGANEFKKCFGFYPNIFEPPELKISLDNKKILQSLNFSIFPRNSLIFHKVYHCTDYEKKSYLVRFNSFIKII